MRERLVRVADFDVVLLTVSLGRSPAVAAMSSSASVEKRLIRPRVRSDTRGCVTPKNVAASA